MLSIKQKAERSESIKDSSMCVISEGAGEQASINSNENYITSVRRNDVSVAF